MTLISVWARPGRPRLRIRGRTGPVPGFWGGVGQHGGGEVAEGGGLAMHAFTAAVIAGGGPRVGVAQDGLDIAQRDAVAQTGNRQCSKRVEYPSAYMIVEGYSSGLVNAFAGEFGGVAGPVPAGLVDPVGGGGGVDVEQVGQDRGGHGRGESGEGGAASGLGVGAEGSAAFPEAGGGQGLAGRRTRDGKTRLFLASPGGYHP
jgi:hypothetical protein